LTIELLAKTLPPMKCQFLIREVRADASVAVAKADVNGALDTNIKEGHHGLRQLLPGNVRRKENNT
jgi:hypothetical protein